MLSTVLPVLMTLGAGLGVALHSLLTNWSNYINIGQIPSLKLDKGGVSIAYDPSGRDLIPIQIDDEGRLDGCYRMVSLKLLLSVIVIPFR